jgi:hypothetical protein
MLSRLFHLRTFLFCHYDHANLTMKTTQLVSAAFVAASFFLHSYAADVDPIVIKVDYPEGCHGSKCLG